MSDDLIYLSAVDLTAGYRRKKFSPVEVIDAVLARIAKLEPKLNAWQLVDEKAARRQAKASAERWSKNQNLGPLDGVPTAIKDVTETKGWPTLNGSLAIDPKGPWKVDAIVVERLKGAGAILVGKTATPEFAWKGVTQSKLKGITRNPWNPKLTTGGSSGGAAAAIASGMAAIATGTDSGGSIREPASFCSIVGFKPSFGRVPVWPPSPLMTIEHCGPLTRTVRDAAIAFSVMAGPDPRDGFALAEPAPGVLSGLDTGVEGLRIGMSMDLGFTPTDPAIAGIVAETGRVFRALGARVENAKITLGNPNKDANVLYDCLAALLVDGLGSRARKLSEPDLIGAAERGRKLGAVDLLAADAARRDLTAGFARLHEDYDLLVCPTVCVAAFTASQDKPDGWASRGDSTWMDLTFPFDLTGQPAISIPCGFTADGRPVGVQIVGPRSADALVLRAARAYEKVNPVGETRPPL
ncbi:MAG: amidase [Alphaproteobacteria bacterium]|nr:amidase [Alphaproteobacteria bacterium]